MPKDQPQPDDWPSQADAPEYEGQLAVDVYQTQDAIIVQAPIAGVNKDDIEISVTDEVLTIRGQRQREERIHDDNYFTQECYWGAFSRSYLLPIPVEADGAQATLKNGILTVTIPKQEKSKTKVIKVSHAE